jgi:transcriptional regulator with XRE-family HTH domain
MPGQERAADRGARRGRALIAELGRELHNARLQHGLSQEAVGRAAGLSDTEIGRIERGQIAAVSVVNLARLAGVVGLELSARAYPTGAPIRDKAHIALLGRLRERVAQTFTWQTEVPLGPAGDLRAWDALLGLGRERVGVEAETRITDLQAVARRLALKGRDGRVAPVVLLLANTRTNRAALRNVDDSIPGSFPISAPAALAALRDGRILEGNAVILL